jgi:mRNA interferase MazF
MRAGELYLVDFGEPVRGVQQANVRPAMVVHSDSYVRIPNLAIVCPITRVERRVPNHVAVPAGPDTGLGHVSFVMTEQIRVVDRRFVGASLGAAPRDVTNAVLRIVRDRIIATTLR